MPLQLVVMTNGASGYKNQSNKFIWVYSQVAVTLTDASGNAVKFVQFPGWLPPGWTANTGTSTDETYGLQGDIPEFAGFLSRKSGIAIPSLTSLAATTAIQSLSAAELEKEIWTNPNIPSLPSLSETEAWTHNP